MGSGQTEGVVIRKPLQLGPDRRIVSPTSRPLNLRRGLSAALALIALEWSSHAAAAAGSATQAQVPALEVAVASSRVNLTARQAPLAEVLTAIGRQAGLTVVLRGEFNTPVTETLVDVPLDAAIRRLTRWHSIVLIFDSPAPGSGDGRLSEIWVTSPPDDRRGQSAAVRPAPVPGLASGAGSGSVPSESRPPRRERAGDAAARPVVPARNPRLAAALKNETPEEVGSAVAETLVRERGVQGALLVLRDAATREPDPGVRRRAIRTLAALDSPDATEAIRATLNDDHPGVRSEAQAALRRLARSRPQ
jgi:HEAT repeat protein